ncbi:MAG: tetratricopeptide repeat protein [Verrucomicrobiales bacterium]|nr:tetratricopeptide repeat protein [Verrucomicrobiales bacterium]
MRRPLVLFATLSALLLLGAGGCRTRESQDNVTRPKVYRAGQRWDTRLLDLNADDERQIEANARFAAGMIAELNDSIDAALPHYQAAILNDPDNEELILDVTRKLIQRRRLEDARQLLEAVARRPKAPGTLWAWLGTIHSLQGNPTAALAAHQEAIRRDPDNFRGYQGLAQVYLETSQPAQALDVLKLAAARPHPDLSFLLQVAESLAGLQRAHEPVVGDLKPDILGLLERAANQNPESGLDRLRLGDLYQSLGESPKALAIYRSLLDSQPNLPGLRERLTEMYLRADDSERAIEQLNGLAAANPTSSFPPSCLGLIALERKRYDEAINHFNQALDLDPGDSQNHVHLAIALLSQEKAESALEVLERARAKFAHDFELEFYTASALMELKRYDQAVRHLMNAEIIAGASLPGRLNHLFYFQAGMANERAKLYDEAARYFEKAIQIKPDFAEALNYLGYMWAERGEHLDRAIQHIRKAVELEPTNGAFIDSLAWALYQHGKTDEALTHQMRAIELTKEPDATLYDHLGDILHKLNRFDDAQAAWRRAFEIEPKPEIEEKLRKPKS